MNQDSLINIFLNETHRTIMDDLFMTIKNIIKGISFVSTTKVNNFVECKIQSPEMYPTVILVYENTNGKFLKFGENENREKIPLSLSINVTEKNGNFDFPKNNPETNDRMQNNEDWDEHFENIGDFCIVNIDTDDTEIQFLSSEKFIKNDVSEPNHIAIKRENALIRNFHSVKVSENNHLKCTNMPQKPHACNYCEKTFMYLKDKRRHERTHTGEKPYSCSYCSKKFSTFGNKHVHERVHTGEKPYACRFCGKTFTQITPKQIHERRHTGERPYHCSYCEKSFTDLSSKKRHERVHTGEQPYKCEYCQRWFANLANKRKHEKLHMKVKPSNKGDLISKPSNCILPD